MKFFRHHPAGAATGLRCLGALALGASLGLLAGCAKKSAPDPSVLARVGPREIRVADLKQEMEWRQKNRRPVPDAPALLEEMVAQELMLQRARAAGLEKDSEVQRAYRNVLITKIKERELTPRVETAVVSPEELRAQYEKQIAQFTRPAKARLAVIHIKTDPKMSAEKVAGARARIDEARQAALALPKDAKGFGVVAVNFSEDQSSRYKGGDIGWFDQGLLGYSWPEAVVSAGFALAQAGDLSDVIPADRGFYLVTKLDTRDALVTPLAQVEDGLRRRLLVEKKQAAERAFQQELRRGVPLQLFPEALAALPATATAVAKRDATGPPGLP